MVGKLPVFNVVYALKTFQKKAMKDRTIYKNFEFSDFWL